MRKLFLSLLIIVGVFAIGACSGGSPAVHSSHSYADSDYEDGFEDGIESVKENPENYFPEMTESDMFDYASDSGLADYYYYCGYYDAYYGEEYGAYAHQPEDF